MRRFLTVLASLLAALWLTSCGGEEKPAAQAEFTAELAPVQVDAAPFTLADPVTENASLILRAHGQDRETRPNSDEVFEFLVANATQSDLPVSMVLNHREGQRWRTSLCVELQCILGDGSSESRTETVILPPFLEKPFQVHLFVDDEAKPGQSAILELRVEPLAANAPSQSLTLSAVVAEN